MAEQPLMQAPPLAEPAEEAAPLDELAGTDDGSSSSDSESESAIKRRLKRANRKMMCLRVEKARTMVRTGITKQSELKSKCQQLTSQQNDLTAQAQAFEKSMAEKIAELQQNGQVRREADQARAMGDSQEGRAVGAARTDPHRQAAALPLEDGER